MKYCDNGTVITVVCTPITITVTESFPNSVREDRVYHLDRFGLQQYNDPEGGLVTLTDTLGRVYTFSSKPGEVAKPCESCEKIITPHPAYEALLNRVALCVDSCCGGIPNCPPVNISVEGALGQPYNGQIEGASCQFSTSIINYSIQAGSEINLTATINPATGEYTATPLLPPEGGTGSFYVEISCDAIVVCIVLVEITFTEALINALVYGTPDQNTVEATGSVGDFIQFSADFNGDSSEDEQSSILAFSGGTVTHTFSGTLVNGSIAGTRIYEDLAGTVLLDEDRKRIPTPNVSVNSSDLNALSFSVVNSTEDNVANTYNPSNYNPDNDRVELSFLINNVRNIGLTNTSYSNLGFLVTGKKTDTIFYAALVSALTSAGMSQVNADLYASYWSGTYENPVIDFNGLASEGFENSANRCRV